MAGGLNKEEPYGDTAGKAACLLPFSGTGRFPFLLGVPAIGAADPSGDASGKSGEKAAGIGKSEKSNLFPEISGTGWWKTGKAAQADPGDYRCHNSCPMGTFFSGKKDFRRKTGTGQSAGQPGNL